MRKSSTPERTSVQIRNVCAAYGSRKVLGPVSLSASEGSIIELRGANGAGKTTMLRLLAGLKPVASGSAHIAVDGRAATPGDIHLIGHGDTVKSALPVIAQARYWAALLGGSEACVSPALDAMGLGARADVPGRALSAGERRRFALTRLLLADRRVWLLDEPFAALDGKATERVAALVVRHSERGGIVIAAMHGSGFQGARQVWIGQADKRDRTTIHPCALPPPPEAVPAPDRPVLRAFAAVFGREVAGGLTHRVLPPLGLYLGCASVVPLAAGRDSLASWAPPMTVIALALAALLPAERMFRGDLVDGTLDTVHASCVCPAEILALAKLLGVWAGIGLPLALLSPVSWLMLGGPLGSVAMSVAVSVLAGGGFVLFAGLAAALAAGLSRAGAVIAVVALPFFWPMMIFASATLRAHAIGDPFMPSLSLTAAASLFALALTPFAVAGALRAATE